MGSVGGLMSTANDLSKYYKALLQSWHGQAQLKEGPFDKSISWLFAPLQIMQTPAFREKSYAAGWVRSQLPTTVGDVGVNPGLVTKMPVLADGIESRIALWHQGSLVGATSFVMLLPEMQSAVLVLTNTMAKNDAADWIGQLLIETLLDSPIRHDYVNLAALSAERAMEKYQELEEKIESGRTGGKLNRELGKYVSNYVGFGGIFSIQVVQGKSGLEILFQGRDSQRFQMNHHHDDTFTWFMGWDEQIKRARFISYQPSLYFIRFGTHKGEQEVEKVTVLNWVNDASIPEGNDFIRE
jgi:hypothetical protein